MEKPRRKRGAIVAVWMVAIIGIVAGFCVFDPGTRKTFSPYMYSESAGRRQYDYKYLGFIPYSKTVFVPNLGTEDEVQAQFDRAGIVLPKGYRVHDKGANAVRMYYEMGEASHLSFMNPKDPGALYSFFKAQVVKPSRDEHNSDGSFSLSWDSSDGKETIQVNYDYGRDPKTGEIMSSSISVNVWPKVPYGGALR